MFRPAIAAAPGAPSAGETRGGELGAPPLIGVTSSEYRRVGEHHETPEGEPPRREMALGVVYGEAVAKAGGLPVILTPAPPRTLDALLDRLDGLCLSGGPDLHPTTYDAEPHPELGPTEPEADAFELALVRRALRRGLPILGVCRGAQTINVARGGTLHQHVEGHRQTALATQPVHAVRIAPRSCASRVLGTRATQVNSFHHQACDSLGDALVATAWAPDGTIEAIEDRRHPFLLGVQWHAETLVHERSQLALFRALVHAASARAVPGTLAA